MKFSGQFLDPLLRKKRSPSRITIILVTSIPVSAYTKADDNMYVYTDAKAFAIFKFDALDIRGRAGPLDY